jgi:hypothetical protein
VITTFLQELEVHFRKDEPRLGLEIGARIGRGDIKFYHKLVMPFLSPARVLGSVARLWPEYWSAGAMAVIERAEGAVAQQHRIEQALETARLGLRQAEVELADAQQRLAVTESGAAVGAGDVDKNARKRLVAARDEVDFARARVAGLE